MDTEAAERALAEAYDTTPYAGNPYYYSHPSLLAAFGALYGLAPTVPGNSRILELGCSDGTNLIPIAYDLPDSTFIGIDLSEVQIRSGQNKVDTLGLKNIQLETRSIMDLEPAEGKFDYIICHGVYSWVPDAVKQKILDICRHNLADQGIAYISYNVLPGWQFNKSMRDLMLFRTRHIQSPGDRADAAFDLLKTMLHATRESNRFHHVQLRFFGKTLETMPDVSCYLLHEYMEADNDPFYFNEFASALKDNGLQYICDGDQPDFELDSLPGDAADKFEAISADALELEQFIDFINNTRFRRSLICHQGVPVDSDYRLERLTQLFAATDIVPVLDSPDSSIREAKAFRTSGGRRFRTEHSLAQTILWKLSEIKPCTIVIPSLIKAVEQEESAQSEPNLSKLADKIGHVVYSLFFNGVVELLAAPRRCVLAAGDLPTASPVARLLSRSQRVTNLCHRTIVMDDEMARFVLPCLDGTHNRESLRTLMLEAVRNRQVTIPSANEEGQALTPDLISDQLEAILEHLCRCGVMLA